MAASRHVNAWYKPDSGGASSELHSNDAVAWLAGTAAARAARFRRVLPALLFVHILPPEMQGMYDSRACQGALADDGVTPTAGYNGLLAAIAHGSSGVSGVFVGHDHGNTYCCASPSTGALRLCFGHHSGYGGYGDWARGGRVVQLSAAAAAAAAGASGEKAAPAALWSTHIRMEDGSVTA